MVGELFQTPKENCYFYNTDKFITNTLTFCLACSLDAKNASCINILEGVLKSRLEREFKLSEMKVYSQVFKKDDRIFMNIYFQFLRREDGCGYNRNLDRIVTYMNRFLTDMDLAENEFHKYRWLTLHKLKQSEQNLKTKAVNLCFKQSQGFVNIFGSESVLDHLSLSAFKRWFEKSMADDAVNKSCFFIGERLTEGETECLFRLFPASSVLHPRISRETQKIKNRTVVRKVNSLYSFFLKRIKVNNHEKFRNKTLNFFNYYLSGSNTSLLFKKVREDSQLVYDISSVCNPNTGDIIITSKVMNKNIEKVSDLIDHEINELREKRELNKPIYLSTLNYFHLNKAMLLDRPISLTRAYINLLTDLPKKDPELELDDEMRAIMGNIQCGSSIILKGEQI